MTQTIKDPIWRQAMDAEYNVLLKNGTWDLVPKFDHMPIGCQLVFRIKQKLDGTIDKYKSQLIVKGFS